MSNAFCRQLFSGAARSMGTSSRAENIIAKEHSIIKDYNQINTTAIQIINIALTPGGSAEAPDPVQQGIPVDVLRDLPLHAIGEGAVGGQSGQDLRLELLHGHLV